MAYLAEVFDGLLPAAPPSLSLLRVPGVLFTPGADQSHWPGGVSFEPEGCGIELDLDTAEGTETTDFPYWWTECESDGSSAVDVITTGIKGIGDGPDNVTAKPFTLWAGYRCTAGSVTSPARQAEVEARVRRRLESITPAAIERELWTAQLADVAGYDNPGLTDTTVTTLLGGTPTGFVTALGELEQALADADHHGGHMIHAQPRVVTTWISEGLVALVPGRTHLETALGTIVVPGAGYPGTSPKPTEGAANYATSWAYGTGFVRVIQSNVTVSPPGAAQTVERDLNDVEVRAEREAVAFWDRCAHVGVNVSLCDELCGVGS